MINTSEYELIDATPCIRLALNKEVAKAYEEENKGVNFIKHINQLAQQIDSLPLQHEPPLRFTFIVVKNGEEYSRAVNLPIEEGICEVKTDIDTAYPLSLCVDRNWFQQGFGRSLSFPLKVGLIHEMGHVVHGGYFHNLGQISEGFAELLPHYLMDMEQKNQKHRQAIMQMSEKELQTMDFMNKKGMFAQDEIDGTSTQQHKSYMSAYLWMLGYIKRVEQQHNMDKFAATQWILKRFSQIDKWHDEKQKETAVSALIELPVQEVYQGLTLQQEGKDYLKHKYPLRPQQRIKPAER